MGGGGQLPPRESFPDIEIVFCETFSGPDPAPPWLFGGPRFVSSTSPARPCPLPQGRASSPPARAVSPRPRPLPPPPRLPLPPPPPAKRGRGRVSGSGDRAESDGGERAGGRRERGGGRRGGGGGGRGGGSGPARGEGEGPRTPGPGRLTHRRTGARAHPSLLTAAAAERIEGPRRYPRRLPALRTLARRRGLGAWVRLA